MVKARHLCAAFGVAAAVGTVTFMLSLAATNAWQATAVATRLLASVPVEATARVASFALDYRPGGRVMQGPPMLAVAATAAAPSARGACIVTRALFAQRRLPVPPVGTELTLVGRTRVHRLVLAGVLDWERPLRGYPNLFVSPETAADMGEGWQPWAPKTVEELAPGLAGDDARNFDRAKALLLWAAALTALCLLVNTLFLSVEAKRRQIAVVRMVGMTRAQVACRVFGESALLAFAGALLGTAGGLAALALHVACDPATYPSGLAVAWRAQALVVVLSLAVAAFAALVALRPALAVRPLEAASDRPPRRRHVGMVVSFACGFGAFVAVEVWGASLMSAFIPSPEWPDAIVSILPGGVSSFDIAKLRARVKGVGRLHELMPLQVNLEPLEELKGPGGAAASRPPGGPWGGKAGPGRGRQYRNALLLGSDWLPDFRFVAGDRASADRAIRSGDACVITEMMARARGLAPGDELKLDCGRGLKMSLKVVGIVALNWHMVTSRGLVRGLNRMPVNTDGPVFVSFDTVEACDARPPMAVKMTHLWLDYEPAFLATNGVFGAGRTIEREIAETLGCLTEEAGANTVRLHARDEIADGTLAHGASLIGAMARVPFVFILVLSIGFVAMLVASADARRREFLVLRAVGATRGQLVLALVREALSVAGLGVAVGLPGGALVGWLCTAGTRAAMSNWGIPPSFAVPSLPVAAGALGAVLSALLVAVPTSLALVCGGRGGTRSPQWTRTPHCGIMPDKRKG